MKHLKDLAINCTIDLESCDELEYLHKLETLYIGGKSVLPSPNFLLKLKSLRNFVLTGYFRDGDLSPLLSDSVTFVKHLPNKPHYSPPAKHIVNRSLD